MKQSPKDSNDERLFFDSEWIKNRYPADFKARNEKVVSKFVECFHDWDKITILDLGAGFGSNMKYLFDKMIPVTQYWILLDHDRRIIKPAIIEILAHFENLGFKITREPKKLVLERGELYLTLEYYTFDFRQKEELRSLYKYKPDVFTANAFFDLFSKEQITNFLTKFPSIIIYSSLNYIETKLNQNFGSWEKWILQYDNHMKIERCGNSAMGNDFPDFIKKFAIVLESGKSSWILNTKNASDLILANSLLKFIEKSVPHMLEGSEVEKFHDWLAKSKTALSTNQSVSVIHEDVLFVYQM